MSDLSMQRPSEREATSNGVLVWLLVSWLWVGAPLAFGVWQTLMKSAMLFQAPAAAGQNVGHK